GRGEAARFGPGSASGQYRAGERELTVVPARSGPRRRGGGRVLLSLTGRPTVRVVHPALAREGVDAARASASTFTDARLRSPRGRTAGNHRIDRRRRARGAGRGSEGSSIGGGRRGAAAAAITAAAPVRRHRG